MSRGAEVVLGSEAKRIAVPWRWKERKLKWLLFIFDVSWALYYRVLFCSPFFFFEVMIVYYDILR